MASKQEWDLSRGQVIRKSSVYYRHGMHQRLSKSQNYITRTQEEPEYVFCLQKKRRRRRKKRRGGGENETFSFPFTLGYPSFVFS